MGYLKVLATTMVFAAGLVTASNAAANYTFTSSTQSTILTGAQAGNHTLTTAGQTIQCAFATFSGTTQGTSFESITLTPTYSWCTYAGGLKTADVTMNGCDYLITGATQTADFHAIVHIQCPAGKVIEIHLTNFNGAETCTLTIPAQTAKEGYRAFNNAGKEDISLVTTAGLTIKPHGAGGCFFLLSGKYSGETTLQGYEDFFGIEGQFAKVSVDS